MPDHLTPLARISAAIEKLESIKEWSTPGLWSVGDDNEGMDPPRPLWAVHNEAFFEPSGDDEAQYLGVEIHAGSKADADLIALLHRTIDSQLTILRYARPQVEHLPAGVTMFASCAEPGAVEAAMDLASAILGGES